MLINNYCCYIFASTKIIGETIIITITVIVIEAVTRIERTTLIEIINVISNNDRYRTYNRNVDYGNRQRENDREERRALQCRKKG